jgi:hypothetical protein
MVLTMNFRRIAMVIARAGFAGCLALLLVAGCASPSVDWNARVGTYTWADAMAELGQPDRVADLDGGVKAAEWIRERPGTRSTSKDGPPAYLRGETVREDEMAGLTVPPKVLRLSFTPDGKLLDWDRNY